MRDENRDDPGIPALRVCESFLPLVPVMICGPAWQPWVFMWASAFALYAGFKWLTWRRRARGDAPTWRHLAYLFAWPGMNADAFLFFSPTSKPTWRAWFVAWAKTAAGMSLLVSAWLLDARAPDGVVAWMAMTGIVFTLHFGVFHLLALCWRSVGCDAARIMNNPPASESLSEFWGRRWNTAFRDLAHRYIFKPFTARFGPRGGLLAGFVFSGLIHESVITLPARGGYGGPTIFFLIQGLGMLAERSRRGRRIGLAKGATGRLFALATVVLPAGLLFPPAFTDRVALPFLRTLFP